METTGLISSSIAKARNGRKPTTLWKRWKLTISRRICATLLGCRKPTTLWKRWKLGFHQLLQCSVLCWVGNPLLSERDGNLDPARSFVNVIKPQSETHYSLKEMETLLIYCCKFGIHTLSETYYSLKEMETSGAGSWSHEAKKSRKPTTLWKRWKRCL